MWASHFQLLLLLWFPRSLTRLSSCDTQVLLRGRWNLPGSGIKHLFPALADRFFTTKKPRKPYPSLLKFRGLGESPDYFLKETDYFPLYRPQVPRRWAKFWAEYELVPSLPTAFSLWQVYLHHDRLESGVSSDWKIPRWQGNQSLQFLMITLTHINSSNCLLSIYIWIQMFSFQMQHWGSISSRRDLTQPCSDLWMPQVRAEPAPQQGVAAWLHPQPLTPPSHWGTWSWL